jgi:acyl carrier protein
MNRESVISSLRAFILANSNVDDPALLEADIDLFEAGVADSLVAVLVLSHCEEAFGCALDPLELTQENFNSLDAMADMVLRALGTRSTDAH